MASRISQMRNEIPQYPQTPQALSQQQLNESIQRTRALMQQMKSVPNPQIITNLLQQNPELGALTNMLRNGQSLEGIAKQMAADRGADINQVIQQLLGGT